MINSPILIFDLNQKTSDTQWYIVDDRVMGGRSEGSIALDDDGNAHFSGYVTTENNGGFSSMRYNVKDIKLNGQKTFKLKIKGDGKEYQFRVKASKGQYHSYVYNFQTSGEWETIEISANLLVPTFRGRQLDLPLYNAEELTEVGFLIGNKKMEKFSLLINHISVE